MKKTFIEIDESGNIKFFDDDFELFKTENMEIISKRRLARIEPANFVLRILFHLFRILSFFNIKVIKWTRTWKCKWRLKVIRYYSTREEAVNIEKEIVRILES